MRLHTLLLTLFSAKVLFCFTPIRGEEYNALVVITKIGKNRYSYEFPTKVDGYKNDGTVILVSTLFFLANYAITSGLKSQHGAFV